MEQSGQEKNSGCKNMLADFEEVSMLLQKLKALCNVHGQMFVPKQEHFRHLLCAENVCSAIFTRAGSFEPFMTLVWVA